MESLFSVKKFFPPMLVNVLDEHNGKLETENKTDNYINLILSETGNDMVDIEKDEDNNPYLHNSLLQYKLCSVLLRKSVYQWHSINLNQTDNFDNIFCRALVN